jgi:glycerophosphoryl diester phosphodiesterase
MLRRTAVAAVLGAGCLLLAAAPAAASPQGHRPLPAPGPQLFDVEPHRGGIGLTTENTLEGFQKAMELGVTTLELDVQITEDQYAVVTHDRRVSAQKCRDTAPVVPGDPEFPYVGDLVKNLTLAQVRTLDCGQPLANFPEQEVIAGVRMPLLRQVFVLVNCYQGNRVWLNVETKVEAGTPQETAPREQFVEITADEIRRAGLLNRVTIQSFDWGALMLMRTVEPRLPIVALTNGDFLQVGQPGASPWLGGIDVDDFDGSYVRAADSFGADALSPVHGNPQGGTVSDPGYVPFTTAEMVREAHALGMAVVPWTIDDKPTMASLIDKGVDGIITDYPDRLRELMAERDMTLPLPVRERPGRDCLAEAHATS